MNPNLIDASAAQAMLDSALAAKESELSRGVLIGVLVVGVIVFAAAFLGASHSSLDWNSSVHLGAIPERTPQDRPPTSPVPYQKPMPASSDSGWKVCA